MLGVGVKGLGFSDAGNAPAGPGIRGLLHRSWSIQGN